MQIISLEQAQIIKRDQGTIRDISLIVEYKMLTGVRASGTRHDISGTVATCVIVYVSIHKGLHMIATWVGI
jgi:hypothetical protein